MVLTILNILHLSFTLSSIYESGPTSNITLFTDPITTILTYRFLLDLKEASQRDMKLDPEHPLHYTASDGVPSFVRAVDPTEAVSATDIAIGGEGGEGGAKWECRSPRSLSFQGDV
ncbi:hypothetical protein L226DRAFT_326314 [Lentinus tigrinus ALCF2SS1-7]|nr:hypothetical protein L226DRAFT_326314 [Lentinus tigrinus ALCF2SS1-7]